MERNKDYCVILAGGIGRRLWPCSRREHPKQFLDFFGTGRTLLQQTYDRFARFLPAENIFVSTFGDYADEVRRQLPDVSADRILCEPVQLSTAPAAMWASFHIRFREPDACVVVTPADHHIVREDRFGQQVCEGLDIVRGQDVFLSMGVKALHANTGYGYIQRGEEAAAGQWSVKSFTEKPDLEYARRFVESGEFLWNTGLFMWHVRTMAARLKDSMPPLAEENGAADRCPAADEELRWVSRHYAATTHRSIDLFVLGETNNVHVKECDFGWADIGCWPEIHRLSRKDADGNAVITPSRVMFSGCSDNLVRLPEGMAAVIRGLDGYLVAQEGHILVVCPNDDPALVRRLVNEAQVRLGEEYV